MRKVLLVCALAFAGTVNGCGAQGGSTSTSGVVVTTQNLYYGTEFDAALGAILAGDEAGFVVEVTAAWGRVNQTDFRLRARAIADRIVRADADLVALQEAALWRTQSPGDPGTPATAVAFDFVQILQDELAARGHAYVVAATFTGMDVEFPYLNASFELDDVRLTDREVILLRQPGSLTWGNPQDVGYDVNLAIPGVIEVRRGWASVDVDVGGHPLRFVATHLEADEPDVRAAQAAQLFAAAAASPLPVIVAGDFNHDLTASSPEVLAFQAAYESAGLRLAAPTASGVTCCADELLVDETAVMLERLDLILVPPGLAVVGTAVSGSQADEMLSVVDGLGQRRDLWASDHAAVSAVLEFAR